MAVSVYLVNIYFFLVGDSFPVGSTDLCLLEILPAYSLFLLSIDWISDLLLVNGMWQK